MTEIIFHPEAEAEFLAAVNYYEAESTGLGLRFARVFPHLVARYLDVSGLVGKFH